MKIHNLQQGTPEWHAHRAQFDNASDAPAVLGVSPYKKRSQLLRERHTGIAPDVDAITQRRFDAGHRFEALARPLAEKIIGEALYALVGSKGNKSASFDGLTMTYQKGFEHKSLNDELRSIMHDHCTGADLPVYYRAQLEQQCLVADCESILFMASKWNDADQLIEERHCWYFPDPELRADILRAWDQFAADLANYEPVEVVRPEVAAPTPGLPAVSVRMDGAIAVVSNLPDFGTALRAFIALIPATPVTDQEFADAESACKTLKKAESALDAAENAALSGLVDVEEMRRLIADYRALARSTRLAKEKEVEAQKLNIRNEQVQRGKALFAAHIGAHNERLGKPLMPDIAADFAGAIKGKKLLDSLQGAIDDELARAKIAADQVALRLACNLELLRTMAPDHRFLFADADSLVLKGADDLAAVIKTRIADHIAAEAQHQRQVQAHADLEQSEIARLAALNSALIVEAQPATASTVVPIRARSAANSTPTLRLGQIGERLGFNVTADFLRSLGIDAAARDRNAVLYFESDFATICAALVNHITTVQRRAAA